MCYMRDDDGGDGGDGDGGDGVPNETAGTLRLVCSSRPSSVKSADGPNSNSGAAS